MSERRYFWSCLFSEHYFYSSYKTYLIVFSFLVQQKKLSYVIFNHLMFDSNQPVPEGYGKVKKIPVSPRI